MKKINIHMKKKTRTAGVQHGYQLAGIKPASQRARVHKLVDRTDHNEMHCLSLQLHERLSIGIAAVCLLDNAVVADRAAVTA